MYNAGMINIVSGVRYLQVITSGAYNLDWTVSYYAHIGERVIKESKAGQITTPTTTTILGVAGPDPVVYYEAFEVHLKNRDATNANTVTLITDAVGGGDVRHITPAVALAAGEMLSYVNGEIRVYDSTGMPKFPANFFLTDAELRASPVPTKETRSSTPSQSSVADNAASTTILASNANRLGATVTNDSSAALYLLLGSGAASTTSYTVRITQYGYYEVPFGYTGQINGIWASDPNDGAARVTELTA